MWNRKTKNGKYKFVERYKKPDGTTAYVSTTLATDSIQSHNKARQILNSKIEKLLEEFNSDSPVMTFGELSDEWLNLKKKRVKLSTYTLYKRTCKKINTYIGDTLTTKLTAGQINRMLIKMFNGGNKYKTVLEAYKIVKNILKFAVQYSFMESNDIADKLVLEKINVSEKDEDKYLEPEEAERLFSSLIESDYEEWADFFKLQMQTGLRFGEAASLHQEEIDLNKGTLHIKFTYDRANKKFTLPKGNKERIIAINAETVNLIQHVLTRRRLLLVAYGVRETDLLFFRKDGTPLNNATALEVLHAFEPEDKVYTTHIFRHTFITRMVENNIAPNLIAQHVGHEGTDLIERVYSHFSDKMNSDLKQAIWQVKI